MDILRVYMFDILQSDFLRILRSQSATRTDKGNGWQNAAEKIIHSEK